MALKYLFLGCVVLVGIVAFSIRDEVTDAFDLEQPRPDITVHGFDPAARGRELQSTAPEVQLLRVVQAADTREQPLSGLPVAPTTPNPQLQGGAAVITGTVTGPGGRVAGATVRIERFEGEVAASTDLTTDANGAFTLSGAPGGRFRVRAWRSPSLAQLGSQVAFVNDAERRNFDLQLSAPSGADISTDWTSSGWVIGSKPAISVTVLEPYVTSDGRVDLGGRSGLPVTFTVGGAVVGTTVATTDANGYAGAELTCAAVGPTTANVRIGTWSRDLLVPACEPPPTTTTTTTTTTVPAPGTPGAPPTPGAPAPPAPTAPVSPAPTPGA